MPQEKPAAPSASSANCRRAKSWSTALMAKSEAVSVFSVVILSRRSELYLEKLQNPLNHPRLILIMKLRKQEGGAKVASLQELTDDLAFWKAARNAIRDGAQSYTANGVTVQKVSMAEILKEISKLEARISRMQRNGKAVKSPVFGE